MECIKKLHETVEILEILWAKCLNCLKNLSANFRMLIPSDCIRHLYHFAFLLHNCNSQHAFNR